MQDHKARSQLPIASRFILSSDLFNAVYQVFQSLLSLTGIDRQCNQLFSQFFSIRELPLFKSAVFKRGRIVKRDIMKPYFYAKLMEHVVDEILLGNTEFFSSIITGYR